MGLVTGSNISWFGFSGFEKTRNSDMDIFYELMVKWVWYRVNN